MAAQETDRMLTEKDLATRFGLTTRTLQGWRKDGIGPAFVDLGRNTIRYRLADVISYEETRLKNKGDGQ